MKLNQFVLSLAVAGASAAFAQSTQPADHAAQHPAAAAAAGIAAQELLSEGEVRKVNREAGKVTLRHGPLANLDMPPMTMVFTAADPKLLDGLKEGDKVRFTADKKDGTYLLIAVRVVR